MQAIIEMNQVKLARKIEVAGARGVGAHQALPRVPALAASKVAASVLHRHTLGLQQQLQRVAIPARGVGRGHGNAVANKQHVLGAGVQRQRIISAARWRSDCASHASKQSGPEHF